MLPFDTLLALTAYAFVMTITPGPNNVLLLSSGLNFGLRRTGWHLAGILCGTLLMIGGVGAGLSPLFEQASGLQTFLKLAGSVYMLWLARQLWQVDTLHAAEVARPIRFGEAALFQAINPKVWLMAITVNAAFVPPGEHYAEHLAIAALIFAVTAIPCITLWAASGAALRVWIENPLALRRINRLMAILAATTVVLFWL
ncbi:MAG TPA: LysE family translocator [bacterium]|nr:LysE family translocator [bacterium]